MKARFILSKSKVFEQLNKIESLSDTVSYSVKTNPEIAKILEGHSYFSVHSMEELEIIQDKSKVWFFLQGTKKEEIEELLTKGITNFVVDNTNDLNNLIENLDKKINLLLRIRLKENTLHTGKHFVFGFYSDEVNNLIPKLKQNNLINKIGIHFHRKTQNVSEWSLKEELTQNINKENLKIIEIVNIGGGIPSEYKNFRKEVSDYIFLKIKELKEFLNENKIEMIIEPGRFIAAPAIKLETEVINIYNGNLIVNASVYNSAMDTFVASLRLIVEGEQDEEQYCYTIKGCTPDSLDIFRYKVCFNKELKIGDKIVFLNAGAYNYSSNYFNLPKLNTVIIE